MKIAITGANSGIGRAAALHLARKGHEVWGTARRPESASKLMDAAASESLPVHLVQLDVTDDASVAAGFEEINAGGVPDVLVNNAGVGGNGTLEDMPVERWQEIFDANVHGPVRCTQAVLPGMRARGSGHVCMVSSVVGRVPSVGQPAYVASKWALEGLTETLALEVARFGVRCSIVEPGVTRTAILAKNDELPEGDYGEAYRRMFAMYAALIPGAPGPELTAQVIEDAITSTEPGRMRWRSGADADALVGGREAMTEPEWAELTTTDDDEYLRIWQDRFGIDLSEGWAAASAMLD